MSRTSAAVIALAVCGALAGNAEAAARVFVASYGNDANTAASCSFATPCRGFAAALTVVDSGGEVIALDAAGYGAVTINKSVTLTANPGYYAGIGASSGNAVTIATAGVKAVLRGLNINGTGAGYGVKMTGGAALSVENCIVSNFADTAVFVNAAASVQVVDSVIRDNGNGIMLQGGASATIATTKVLRTVSRGILVLGSLAGTTTTASISDSVVSGGGFIGIQAYSTVEAAHARMMITRTTASNNQYGVVSESESANTLLTVGGSMATGNTIAGFQQGGTAYLWTMGDNHVSGNGNNVVGTIWASGGV